MKAFPVRPFVIVLVLLGLVLSSCATPTAAPTIAPTLEPTATSIPPTATPTIVPTATPVPAPRIQNALFSTSSDMSNAIGQDGTFKAGPSGLYFSIDQSDIPPTSTLSLELKRDGGVILSKSDAWKGSASGTYAQALLTDSRLLIPGAYKLTLKLAGQSLEGRFKIDTTGEPGALLLSENFDDNQLGWAEHSDKFWSAKVEDGQLSMTSLLPTEVAYSALPINLKDFDLSVVVSATKTFAQSYYSIIFRSGGAGSYVFTVFTDGWFDVQLSSATTSKGFQTLIDLQRSSAIQRGAKVNRIRIVAKDNKFAFYINDQLVGSLTDNKSSAGTLGFIVSDLKQSGASATFDDLQVTLPKDEVAVLPTPIVPAAPKGTAVPKATAVPSTPPLLTVVQYTLDQVNAFKGALFQGGESCADFFRQFNGIVNGPTFDVSGQSSAVQSAYGLYRQALAVAGSKATVFNDICSSGGGVVGKLDVLVEIKLLDQALGLLDQAYRLLTQ
jgi:hypothetical protein